MASDILALYCLPVATALLIFVQKKLKNWLVANVVATSLRISP